jgi:hypothetical protein
VDNQTLMMLARFTFQARKLLGAVDSNMIANDAEYRDNIFKEIDAKADEPLLMLSLDLRNRLGMLPGSVAKEPVAEPEPKTDTDKYKFGARG